MTGDVERLATMLQVAVPLLIAQVASGTPDEQADTLAAWRKAGDEFTHGADTLMHERAATGAENGAAAKTFAHLARAVAACAHTRGGVTCFGVTWCAKHHPGGTAGSPVCRECFAGEPPPPVGDPTLERCPVRAPADDPQVPCPATRLGCRASIRTPPDLPPGRYLCMCHAVTVVLWRSEQGEPTLTLVREGCTR